MPKVRLDASLTTANASGNNDSKLSPCIRRLLNSEPTMASLSDSALQAKTAEFKSRLMQGKCFGQQRLQAFALHKAALKLGSLGLQSGIGKRGHRRLRRVDARHFLPHAPD